MSSAAPCGDPHDNQSRTRYNASERGSPVATSADPGQCGDLLSGSTMHGALSEDERGKIAAALRDGQSVGAVARAFGRSKSTVSVIARNRAVPLERSRTEKAAAAVADYALERRVDLLNQGFAKAAELLPSIQSPMWLQAWSISLGILIDKRRLEDGEATGRVEVSGDDARERLAARLDDLAARRRAKARPESAVG